MRVSRWLLGVVLLVVSCGGGVDAEVGTQVSERLFEDLLADAVAVLGEPDELRVSDRGSLCEPTDRLAIEHDAIWNLERADDPRLAPLMDQFAARMAALPETESVSQEPLDSGRPIVVGEGSYGRASASAPLPSFALYQFGLHTSAPCRDP